MIHSKEYQQQLEELITNALKEDVGDGDHSSLSCIDANANGKAILKIKDEGVLAGVDVAEKIFHLVEPTSVLKKLKNDGDKINSGEIAFEVEATIHTILKCERLVLNCMQRMSGIATLTKKYTQKLNGYSTKLL